MVRGLTGFDRPGIADDDSDNMQALSRLISIHHDVRTLLLRLNICTLDMYSVCLYSPDVGTSGNDMDSVIVVVH